MSQGAASVTSPWGLWGEVCGVASSAYDVACGARSIEAFLSYDADARPLNGRAVLLSSHLLLSEAVGGRVVFWVALASVRGMRCRGRLLLPGRSFDCATGEADEAPALDGEDDEDGGGPGTTVAVARRIVALDIFLEGAAVTLRAMGAEGEQFARAALLLWRRCHAEAASPLHHPGDAAYALAGAPVRLSATVVQCMAGEAHRRLEAGEAVEIVMPSERDIWIARRPRMSATFWRDLRSGPAEELQVLPVDSLAALVALPGTTLRLVGCGGDTWLFAVADPATDAVVRHALQRLIELFLLGVMRRGRGGGAVEPRHRLRYFDLAALYQQYCAMDAEGVGYILCSSLEAAMGPLLACDSRLVQAMRCHDDDGGSSGKVSLPTYLNHMRVLLQGSVAERANVAFRAFGGDTCGGAVAAGLQEAHGAAHAEEEEGTPAAQQQRSGRVRLTDFKLIVHDILAGLAHAPADAAEPVEDAANRLLTASLHADGNDDDDTAVSFEAFLPAYKLLMGLLRPGEVRGYETPPVFGTPRPPLGFGSAHWVLLTYVMTGVEVSVRAAAAAAADCGEKNTFDLTAGTPTIAGLASLRSAEAAGGAPNFFQKRLPSLQGERVTFTDYNPLLFAAVRRRFGIAEAELLRSLGISALRASLLLGCLCAPRVLRSSGRSGALLLSSHDYRFILKRVTHTECRTLRGLLPAYVEHLDRHPHTLLPRYSGLYALWRGGEKATVVVAANVFAPAQLPVTEVYDLKGSTAHRTTAAEDRRHGAAGKDNDFLADKRRLRLPAAARRALLAQLEADTALLEKANRLDYSLLVGIHSGAGGWGATAEAAALALRQRQRMEALAAALDAPASDPNEDQRGDSVFHAYYGGVASADGTEVYFLGIVDCLTTYGLKKVGEHYSKSVLLQDMNKISCVPPPVYRSRFLNFMRTVMDS
ncbi:putative phosphatidylinositol-4-phosphate 5-kinase [Trypanosoma conorhini]|uniref:Putative phosphatidylinositol-4-phosphate 5-kinase n=1 Tax=Trypanosoma conorhini TaxID=83891 RepID=A0A422P8N4_9TRYP|nr:putative phosphatidylinositol-4-phosphate 5-kinase [Trypanosoma conorhini]RNF14064.1 putative phosphatidylinositol-4-phosphate 5-kinase [Trypanosoma conorhini]